MRGKACSGWSNPLHFRITPAYAGKRHCLQISPTLARDHPRLCGEKVHGVVLWLVALGSPPPMRGKVVMRAESPLFGRITPAYAGKSFCCITTIIRCKDHPRLCGEKILSQEAISEDIGSPPPMRGKGCTSCRAVLEVGITPAYAGKRMSMARRKSLIWDHPRLCGEKD